METTFGDFLSQKRKENSLTQKELAEKLFVSESAVSKWEQNRSKPDISILPTLSSILGVSEHELITASVDSVQRENNIKAKKWNILKRAWDLFFGISYTITLLTCFIVNLCANGKLSWFWIVLGSIILASTFTNLPAFIKKARLFMVVLTELIALIILLGICCIYTDGNWFLVSVIPIVTGFLIIFLPVYIKLYSFPVFIKKHRQIFCLVVDYISTLGMMYIIENYTNTKWVNLIVLPLLTAGTIIALLVIVTAKYLKINKFFKSSIILFVFAVSYPTIVIWADNLANKRFQPINWADYIPNLAQWTDKYINNNVTCLVSCTLIVTALLFLCFAIAKLIKKD